jgi:hypothetical protein
MSPNHLHFDWTLFWQRILQRIYHHLRFGAYCAVISKSDVTAELDSIGFDLIESASIPPTGFSLPSSKKSKNAPTQKKTETSHCVVSIVTKKVV